MTHCESLQVTYTSGRQVPTVSVPPLACDCHVHVFDPVLYPYMETDERNQPPATVPMLRMLWRRLGVARGVIVTPSAYGFNNAPTLDALEQLGGSARAVVVLSETVSDRELERMHALGVRGIRLNVVNGGSDDQAQMRHIASRVHELGWHVQFWLSADDIAAMHAFFGSLPNQVVFDHFAHLKLPQGAAHPAFKTVCDLMHQGKAWVKISGVYFVSADGDPGYADVVPLGQAYVSECPERLVWGTDWPHPRIFTNRAPWPDDAAIMDLMAAIAPDMAVRNRILAANPALLYDFGRD